MSNLVLDPAPAQDPILSLRVRLYLWLTAVFTTCLLMANVLGVKLFSFPTKGWLGVDVEHTVGMLPFPITFLITDLVNEYYGNREARRMTYIAFVMAALAFVLIWIGRVFPIKAGVPGTATHDAFENIFGSAALMYIASILAFLMGSLLDIFIFSAFKRATGGRFVWLRATGSTIISQLFDSFAITFLFFVVLQSATGGKPAELDFVYRTALTGYVLKFVIAVALTPAIYAGRWFIRVRFNMEPIPAK